jgi:hypothetical protein
MRYIDKFSSIISKHSKCLKAVALPTTIIGLLLSITCTSFSEANSLVSNLYTVVVLDLAICSVFSEFKFKPFTLRLLTVSIITSPLGVLLLSVRVLLLLVLLFASIQVMLFSTSSIGDKQDYNK